MTDNVDRPGGKRLAGRYVTLEPLDWARHEDGLKTALCGPENAALWTYIPIGPFLKPDEFQQTFEKIRVAFGWETVCIVSASQNAVLGMASYMRIREAHRSAEVGCVVFGHQLQRTSAATEAMYLMAQHVFEDLGYRRYEWKCDNANAASRKAAERLGFTFEGVFRNDMLMKGRSRDTAWFSIIEEEWPSRQQAFERWLSSDNFTADGQQIATLPSFRN